MRFILLAVLAAVCANAQAEPIATMENKMGGKIVLTNEVCEDNGRQYQGLFRIYTFAPTGTTLEGCYYLDRALNVFQVVYKGGPGEPNSRSVYPVNNFTAVPSAQNQSNRGL